jgi:hypothetical protein
MSEPLTAAARRTLERLARSAPAEPVAVIVTVTSAMTATTLAAAGMTIEQQVPEPPIVMGTMTPAQALAAARLKGVVRLELDAHDVHALDGD